MKYQTVEFNLVDNIGVLTLNNPSGINVLGSQTVDDLRKAFDAEICGKELRVVIVVGEGKTFIAGADIKEATNYDSTQATAFTRKIFSILSDMEKMGTVFIAAVNGVAFGGGFEVALACDIRIAGVNAKFAFPETGLGISLGAGGAQRLPKMVGISKAKELIFTGDVVDAEEALRLGLVSNVADQDSLMETAYEMARKIAAKSPIGTKYAKQAIQTGISLDIDKGSDYENLLFSLCYSTEDQKEGMKAFTEKRLPVFTGK
jgi:enoyl-CoA hydratase